MLTVNELSAIKGVPPATIYRYIYEGLETGFDWKNRLTIDPDKFDKFKSQKKSAGRPKKDSGIKFRYDWRKFYYLLKKRKVTLKSWCEDRSIDVKRIYWIRRNVLYPTQSEKDCLKQYIKGE